MILSAIAERIPVIAGPTDDADDYRRRSPADAGEKCGGMSRTSRKPVSGGSEQCSVGFRSTTEAIDTTIPGGWLSNSIVRGARAVRAQPDTRTRVRRVGCRAARGRKGNRKPAAAKLAHARSTIESNDCARGGNSAELARLRSTRPVGLLQARIRYPLFE